MTKNIIPPDWENYDPGMLISVQDMQYYFENYTEVTNELANTNKLAVDNLTGRVAKLEQEIPTGPGGTGAFLNLGGVPERYPTAEEMVAGGLETGFMVIARTDGIYFYNPASKTLIKPKSGGGTIALQGQLPMIYDSGHQLKHASRAYSSGVYSAKCADIGLTSWVDHEMCKVLVVVTDKEEYHTAMGPSGFASRIFREGELTSSWTINSGGSGGGTVDPSVIQEIKARLEALEAHDHLEEFLSMTDVNVDPVLDAEGLLYMSETGIVRGGKKNPLLSSGKTHVHTNSVGAAPVITVSNVSSSTVASNNTIILKANVARTVTLPEVVSFDTFNPASTQVREGRTTFIVNMGNIEQTIQLSPGGMFYIEGGMDGTTAVIPAKTVFVYNPAIIDNGSGALVGCWIYMGNYQLRTSDLTVIRAEITDLQSRMSDNEGKTLNLEQEVEGLKTAPKPKFTELADTPSGYQPGKLVGYNLSGTAMVAVDPINNFLALTDTPNSFSGQALKAVTVKSDNSGLEFSTLPNINPLITDINNLENEIIRLDGANYTQDQATTALTAQVTGLVASDGDATSHWSDVSQTQAAASTFIDLWGTVVNKIVTLPDIVAKDVTPVPSNSVRTGHLLIITNRSNKTKRLRLGNGCLFYAGGTGQAPTSDDFTLDIGNTVVLVSGIVDDAKWWMFVGAFSADHTVNMSSINGLKTSVDEILVKETVNGVYWGPNKLLGSIAQRTSTSVTQAEVVINNYIMHSPSSGTGIISLPDVVTKGASPTSTQVRGGRSLTILSNGSRATSLSSSSTFPIITATGSAVTNYSVPAGRCIQLVAGSRTTGGFCWYILSDSPIVS